MGERIEEITKTRRVIIIGGGLVGALNACFFAKRGWKVDVYEARKDIREIPNASGRSINLALSERGLAALRAVDCDQQVLENAIPMYGRYIHDQNGKTFNIQLYGIRGEHIFSVSRNKLNAVLLTHAESFPRVSLHFQHKLKLYDRETKSVLIYQLADNKEIIKKADLICGCDGAFSAVRRHFLQTPDFNFSQNYIDHKYVELSIKPDRTENFKMKPNYFHLWPRGQFCLIGLPNTDKTFTVTLLAPSKLYSTLKDEKKLEAFFKDNFPDALQMIELENVFETFRKATPGHFVSIKCEPHHADNRLLLLGDAAHAMVPFYGQGMNAGFEDCLVFHEIIDQCENDVAQALKEYSSIRCMDSHAICDLALYNYSELRDLVNRTRFKIRKKIDFGINKLLAYRWMPLYNMVTFSRIRYHEIVEERQRQDHIVNCLRNCIIGFSCLVVGTFSVLYHRI